MKYIIYGKFGGTVLVILAFGVWLGTSAILPMSSDWNRVGTYLVAGISFFVVGCVLPEYRDKRFILGRRSALQLMAFFLWLAVGLIARIESIKDTQESVSWFRPMMGFGALIVAFLSYFLAIYLIRGFRAQPEYEVSPDNTKAEQDSGGNGG